MGACCSVCVRMYVRVKKRRVQRYCATSRTSFSYKYVLTRPSARTPLRVRTYPYQHTQEFSHICIIYKYIVCDRIAKWTEWSSMTDLIVFIVMMMIHIFIDPVPHFAIGCFKLEHEHRHGQWRKTKTIEIDGWRLNRGKQTDVNIALYTENDYKYFFVWFVDKNLSLWESFSAYIYMWY